jgi:Zn-dependent peptidase ImmA (M78 family)/transcriptional regulator with XRE-family HTH domain
MASERKRSSAKGAKQMSQSVNPDMIVLARESRGMTQIDLGKCLRTTQGYVSKVEHKIYEASNQLAEQLSRTLDYPVEFFFEEYRPHPLGMGFYRKHQSLPARLKAKVDAHANLHRLRIQRMLRSVDLIESKVVERSLSEYGSPDAIAMAMREYWKIPRGPIQNLTETLESAGIIVMKLPLDTRHFSGVNVPTDQLIYIILTNSVMPSDRDRYTLAHELGHIIMHRLPTENMEEEANRFAREFLMPQQELRSQLYKLSLERLSFLKRYWKVSMAAILEQARILEAVSERKYRTLRVELSQAGYILQEPPELDPPEEKPSLLSELINLYLDQLHYSIDELSHFLRLFKHEFLSLYIPSHQHLRVIP